MSSGFATLSSWMQRAVLHCEKARQIAGAGDFSHALERKSHRRCCIFKRAVRRRSLAVVRRDFPARTINAGCRAAIHHAAASSRSDATAARAHSSRTQQERNGRRRVDAHIRESGIRISLCRRGDARGQIQFSTGCARRREQRARGGRPNATANVRRPGETCGVRKFRVCRGARRKNAAGQL